LFVEVVLGLEAAVGCLDFDGGGCFNIHPIISRSTTKRAILRTRSNLRPLLPPKRFLALAVKSVRRVIQLGTHRARQKTFAARRCNDGNSISTFGRAFPAEAGSTAFDIHFFVGLGFELGGGHGWIVVVVVFVFVAGRVVCLCRVSSSSGRGLIGIIIGKVDFIIVGVVGGGGGSVGIDGGDHGRGGAIVIVG